jgi:hypothetical protein
VGFVATPEFIERYLGLDLASAACIDGAIVRLEAEPASAWARRNRVVGEQGTAWIVEVRCPAGDYRLYWTQPTPEGPLQLLLLLPD